MKMNGVLLALVAAGSAFAFDPVVPGEFTDPTSLKTFCYNITPGYQPPEQFRYPYISNYYLKPTTVEGESVKFGFFVTDYDHSKVRFLDDSHRFTVYCEVTREGGETKKFVKKDVPSGDGEFDLGALPRGDYRVMIRCVDSKGRESHRQWQIFRVRTAAELAIPADKVYKMTAADLETYSLDNRGDYGRLIQVEIPKPEKKINWKDEAALALKTIDEYLAKNDVKNKSKRPGYTIVVPVTDGKIQFRSYERCRVVYDDGYDTNAVEQASIRNAEGIQKLLEDKAAAGFRKLVMLPGTYRISAFRKIEPPDNFTLDLNGATLKQNPFTGASSNIVRIHHRYDTHVVNGTLEGDYFEHDYEHSPNNSEWPLGIVIDGDSRYCSFENLVVRNITGYGGGNGIGHFGPKNSLAKVVIWPGKYVPGGLNPADGTIDESDKFRFTSEFKDISNFTNGWIQCNKYLGYQGIRTRSWHLTLAWYDAEKKFLSSEVYWQYREVPIPEKAKFLRFSIQEASVEAANKTELSLCDFYWPINCSIRNCVFDRCRCVGYAASAMRNYLFEGNEFRYCGETAAKCAFDAEDGGNQMQDAYFLRNWFHDNPINNSILTCRGHNFVLEKNRCGAFFWGGTHSVCVRDNELEYLRFFCEGRLRTGYGRYYNNTITNKVEIKGTDRGKEGWYAVVSDLDKVVMRDHPSVNFEATGRPVGGKFTDAKIAFGSLCGVELERVTMPGLPSGKWLGVVAKDTKVGSVYGTNVFERCEFIGCELNYIAKGKATFIGCRFKDVNFRNMANSNAEFRDCVFEGGEMSGSYWSPSSKLVFSKCVFKLDGKPFLSFAQWNIGRFGFVGCKFEAGNKPTCCLLIKDTRASNSDDAGGRIVFRKCSFDAGVKSAVAASKSGATSKRPIEISGSDNAFATDTAKLVDTANFLPCWTYPQQ